MSSLKHSLCFFYFYLFHLLNLDVLPWPLFVCWLVLFHTYHIGCCLCDRERGHLQINCPIWDPKSCLNLNNSLTIYNNDKKLNKQKAVKQAVKYFELKMINTAKIHTNTHQIKLCYSDESTVNVICYSKYGHDRKGKIKKPCILLLRLFWGVSAWHNYPNFPWNNSSLSGQNGCWKALNLLNYWEAWSQKQVFLLFTDRHTPAEKILHSNSNKHAV